MRNHWYNKFACAVHGLYHGTLGQSSFYVHIPVAIVVVSLAAVLRCSPWEWAILLLCIGLVLSLELMNSALEHLAHGLCKERNAAVGKGLDSASAAVLVGSIFAALIGLLIFANRIWIHVNAAL